MVWWLTAAVAGPGVGAGVPHGHDRPPAEPGGGVDHRRHLEPAVARAGSRCPPRPGPGATTTASPSASGQGGVEVHRLTLAAERLPARDRLRQQAPVDAGRPPGRTAPAAGRPSRSSRRQPPAGRSLGEGSGHRRQLAVDVAGHHRLAVQARRRSRPPRRRRCRPAGWCSAASSRAPPPGADHSSRDRFQCTTSQPPVPRPRSTAVVLTTTRSPTATGPISWVSTYARRPLSSSTRCSPAARREWRVRASAVEKLGHVPRESSSAGVPPRSASSTRALRGWR